MRNAAAWTVDAVGGSLTVALVACTIYCGVIRRDQGSEGTTRLTSSVRVLRGDLAVLQGQLDGALATVGRDRAELAAHGALPSHSPVEHDLQVLSQYARQNQLEISDVRPLGNAAYPGVTELRYAIKASGRFEALMGFFAAFEQAPFWADVTHLKIDAADARVANAPLSRSAELTVSFFSADDAPSERKGG